MGIFSFIASIFAPATNLVDELVTTDEERGNLEVKRAELKNKLAEIESKIGLKLMELQSEAIASQTAMEGAIQKHGNLFTRSVRPLLSIASFSIILLTGLGKIPRDELILNICAGYLGLYTTMRSLVDKRR